MSSIQRVPRFVLVVACASAAAFLLTAPASARAGDMYAALAYSPKTGAYGYSFKQDTLKAAEQKALAGCDADDARIITWCYGGWCVLAVGDNGYYGCDGEKDYDEARKGALEACSKYTKNGHILICVSSDGQVKKE